MNLYDRKEVIRHYLAQEHIIRLLVTDAASGIPDESRGAQTTVLDVGLSMPNPIRGLTVDDGGVRGDFSFGGRPHHVVIPWMAVASCILNPYGTVEEQVIISWPVRMVRTDEPAARGKLSVVK